MRIRCQYLGLTAALALALSISAAADWSTERATPAAAPVAQQAPAANDAGEEPPVPAPVLFLAGGLLAIAAGVRWHQRFHS